MKVLEVIRDINYQGIMTADHAMLRPLVRRMNNPIGEFEFPIFFISDPKSKVGNFYEMGYEILVFDDIARRALSYEVSVAGENYSLEIEGVGTYNALNVTETSDALDHRQTIWRKEEDGGKYKVLKYVFHPNRIVTNSGLFTLAENRFTRIFAVTGLEGQRGDFYARYHEAKLTGLAFTEVWSDESD